MEAGERIADTYGAAMGTAGKTLLSMDRQIETLQESLGNAFLPVLEVVVKEIYEGTSAYNEFWRAMKDLSEAGITTDMVLKNFGVRTLARFGIITDETREKIIEMALSMSEVAGRTHDLRWQFESFPDLVETKVRVTGEEEVKADLETLSGIMSAWKKGEEEKLLIRARLAAIEAPTDVPTERITSDMEEAAIAAAQVSIEAGDVSRWGAAQKLAEDYGAVLGGGRDTAWKMYNYLTDIANLSPIEVEIITTTTGGEFRAGGGPVEAGKPYIVGEREAEMFVPNQAGHIYNQQQLAGGDININTGIAQRAFNNMAEDWMRGLGG